MELFDDRYKVFRKDRDNNKTLGGGVLVAAKNKLTVENVEVNCDKDIECLLLRVRFKKCIFYISSVYVPPNVKVDVYEQILENFNRVLSGNENIIVIGDFNIPHFIGSDCMKSNLLNQFLNLNNLSQFNTILNHRGKLLDLILSNMSVLHLERSKSPLVVEDKYHPALEMSLYMEINQSKQNHINQSYCYDYARGDFDLLYHLIESTDWSNMYDCVEVNDCVSVFYVKLYECIEQAIPKKCIKNKKQKYPIYFSIELIRRIRQKTKLHRLIKTGRASVTDINEFKKLRIAIKKQTKIEFIKHQADIEDNVLQDPSSFWTFVENKRQTRSFPSEMFLNECPYNGCQNIANAFSQFFSAIYQVSSTYQGTLHSQGSFEFSIITEENVKLSIKKLKPKKATGADNVPSYIFKGCSEIFLKPLSYLFNLSLNTNTFPNKLKESVITPVFKSGDINNIQNYRPISILNSLAKIFESILYNDIMKAFENKFAPEQHGFLSGLSTTTNLCILTNCASEAINNKLQLDLIMTDCAKAFDLVDHGICVGILRDLGFSDDACAFIESYLELRFQRVKIGTCFSHEFQATSGVPQGSNLGPLLFLIFINSLPGCLRSSFSLIFADDFKLFKVIHTINDCQKLQEDLESVVKWFRDHNMVLNIEKCSIISFTRKINFIKNDYTINNQTLVRKTECKDLGVHLQSNMKFHSHYISIVNKTYKVLGFVIRNSRYFGIDTTIRLYNALVRPSLEYASIIWAPESENSINLIEMVQKRFLRYLYLKKYDVYPYLMPTKNLLRIFNMQSLQQRRNMHCALFLYNIVNNIKYKKCNLINFVKFHVPKINLRVNNCDMFFSSPFNTSPIDYMQKQCNILVKNNNIDFFNCSVKDIVNCFMD